MRIKISNKNNSNSNSNKNNNNNEKKSKTKYLGHIKNILVMTRQYKETIQVIISSGKKFLSDIKLKTLVVRNRRGAGEFRDVCLSSKRKEQCDSAEEPGE